MCEQFKKKSTGFVECTMSAGPATGIPVCQPFVKVRDGTTDCEDGSDEGKKVPFSATQ